MKSVRKAGSYEVAAVLISGFWFLGCGLMPSSYTAAAPVGKFLHVAKAATEIAGVSAYRVDGLRGSLVPKSTSDCPAAQHLKVKT